jgi:hypothetical protein
MVNEALENNFGHIIVNCPENEMKKGSILLVNNPSSEGGGLIAG